MQAPPRLDVAASAPPRRPRSVVLLQTFGWLLIVAGVVVALYVVHALFLTDLSTERMQSALIERWGAEIGDLEADDLLALEPEAGSAPADDGGTEEGAADTADADDGREGGEEDAEAVSEAAGEATDTEGAVDVDGVVAVLAFHRPGEEQRPVNPEPLAVVDGVSQAHLQGGPGHYPSTALPGEDGNFAVAGHRVTYGRPFYHLDEIRPGDEVHVWDRENQRHVYEVTGTEVVGPLDRWVIGPDPQGTGEPTLTLTTCHPRFSQRERLIMFAELVG